MSKKALVIGGGGDIGRGIIDRLLADGFQVAATTFSDTQLPAAVTAVSVDVTKADSLLAVQACGPYDAVVFSVAAPMHYAPLLKKSWPDFQTMLSVQVQGFVNTLAALHPQIEAKHPAKIIVLTTAYCLSTPPAQIADYITAKYALVGLAKSAAIELAKFGSSVIMIAPGMTKTKLLNGLPEKVLEITAAQSPLGRLLEPVDIAATISEVLASAENFNGQQLPVPFTP